MTRSFRFVGTDETPGSIEVRGFAFVKGGDPVEVTDAALADGLAGNPQFEEVGGPKVDYSEPLEAAIPDARFAAMEARIGALEDEISSLRAAFGASTQPAEEPPVGAGGSDVLAEVDASPDWADEHHSTRIRWANALSDVEVKTAAEADEVILGALADREQNQG